MKYKIKFQCNQPWQTCIECSQQILIPYDYTLNLILEHCPFLSLCGNWPCVIAIFSFLRFLWIFSLLSVLANLIKALFQETSLFSTARRMPSHSNFFVVHVEELRPLPNPSWCHMKMSLKYLNHFSNNHTVSPLTLVVSNTYDGAAKNQQKDFDLVYSSHSAGLLYLFYLL